MYHKEMYILSEGKPVPVVIRNYTETDFDELIAIQAECFPPPFPPELWWSREQLSSILLYFHKVRSR
ncbi:N-acetyltransferase GCN5 [Paenibacillus sp. TCA20]|nr:N-acetyltransferase GCN5 [Paenibacillus sp. TCA20]